MVRPAPTQTLLTPGGSTAIDHLASDLNTHTDGSERVVHSGGDTTVTAQSVASVEATEVDIPGAVFTSTGTALAGSLTVSGGVTLGDLGVSSTTVSGGITTDTVQSINPTDTINVTAGKVVINADVKVSGVIDKQSASSLSVVDNILEISAVTNAGVPVTSVSDVVADGSSIVVPGPPQYLPSDVAPLAYEHALTWNVNAGSFNPDGTPVAPQSQPMWEFKGGALSLAAPDTTSRQSRFIMSPYFSDTIASLGLYYAVGNNATLIDSFSTTPLSVVTPVWVTGSELSDIAAGVAYSLQLSALAAGTYAVTSGSLPAGVTMSNGGLISGTPTATGSYTFTVSATNVPPNPVSVLKTFMLNVATPPTWTTSGTLAPSYVGVAYSATLQATNASSTGFYVSTGTLPPGLTLAAGGLLSGSPTAAGSYSWTVAATSATSSTVITTQAFTQAVAVMPTWVTNPMLADLAVGIPYSIQLFATNAVTYTTTATLPAGMTLSSSGLLSGTPTALGTTTFAVNAIGTIPSATIARTFSLTVSPDPVWVTAGALSASAVSAAYSQQLTASACYTYVLSSGSLPAGLALSSSGLLVGTPTVAGSYAFAVDASGPAVDDTVTRNFTLTIAPLPVWTTASALTDIALSAAYSLQLAATNGVSFALASGSLPAGVTLSSGGLLSGTPTAAGSFAFTVVVTGSATNATASRLFNLLVATPPTWTTAAALAAEGQNIAYSVTLAATNASATGFSVVSGSLPTGVTLSSAGVLSGTPSATGNYTFGVQALSTTSALVGTTQTFTQSVVSDPVWSTASALADAPSGTAYSLQLGASNTVSYSLASGTLPTGVTLSAAGLLSGTPSAAGSYSFTVNAQGNATDAVVSDTFTLKITLGYNYVPYRGLNKAISNATMVITSTGTVYGCGDNSGGQITGSVGSSTTLMTQVSGLSNIVRFADGWQYSSGNSVNFAMNSSGQWYTWGPYQAYQLGNGTSTSGINTTPVAWNGVANVCRMVVLGDGCGVFAKTKSGSWYFWGSNSYSSDGSGTTNPVSTPTLFTQFSGVRDVIAGRYSNCMVLLNGNMYTNGIPLGTSSAIPWTLVDTNVNRVFVSDSTNSLCLWQRNDGSVWGFGSIHYGYPANEAISAAANYNAPIRATAIESIATSAGSSIRDISAGGEAMIVTLANGSAYGVGQQSNWCGSSGNTTAVSVSVTSGAYNYIIGYDHMVSFSTAGALWTGGANANYQCGTNATGPLNPAAITTSFTLTPIGITPAWNSPLALGGLVSTAFAAALDASDAGTYSVTSGSLPSGFTLTTSGYLSGTLSSSASTTTFTVTAYGISTSYAATQSITVYSMASAPAWTTSAALGYVPTGTAYSLQLAATNTAAYTASSLPPGLTLSSSGLLSGTPTAAGSYSFVAYANYVAQTFTLTVTSVTITMSCVAQYGTVSSIFSGGWARSAPGLYNTSTGYYIGSTQLQNAGGTIYKGDYVQVALTTALMFVRLTFTCEGSDGFGGVYVLGSQTAASGQWVLLAQLTNTAISGTFNGTFTNSTAYTYYAVQCYQTNTASTMQGTFYPYNLSLMTS